MQLLLRLHHAADQEAHPLVSARNPPHFNSEILLISEAEHFERQLEVEEWQMPQDAPTHSVEAAARWRGEEISVNAARYTDTIWTGGHNDQGCKMTVAAAGNKPMQTSCPVTFNLFLLISKHIMLAK